jgi:segregation and condensation protein B
MKIDDLDLVKRIVEGVIMAADKPLSKRAIKEVFDELEVPDDELIQQAIEQLQVDCESRGYELAQVASGYRFQVKQDLARWVSRLWKDRAPRYSRALLETMSLVAYRQPITRGEIEDIRGVAVSTQIIRTLLEREWVKIVGHRDVPGRPAVYATTKQFLDYFNLKSLDQLPPLAEIRELGTISRELNIELPPELVESANDDALDTSTRVDVAAMDGEPSQVLEELGITLSHEAGAAQNDARCEAQSPEQNEEVLQMQELAELDDWDEEAAQDNASSRAHSESRADLDEGASEDEEYESEVEAHMAAGSNEQKLSV